MSDVEAIEAITLEDIFPENTKFTLSLSGKEYELKPFYLVGRNWLEKTYPNDELKRIFNADKPDFGEIIKIAYRQLIDKSDFIASNEMVIDDEGVEKMALLTGPVKFERAIKDLAEMTVIMRALTKCIADSEPAMKGAMLAEVKKSIAEANQKLNLSGPKSSTPSQVNTDGQTSKS